MTDVTHAVTQSALEAFTREYLSDLGATICEDGNRWHVRVPPHVDVDFSESHEFDIILDTERSVEEDDVRILTPESEFTQQLLDEAAEKATVGHVVLTKSIADGGYRHPPWILESDVEVVETAFSPYYDRTATSVFVRIDVETVSEFQTQYLVAVTVDIESNDQLPGITELLVEEFFTPKSNCTATGTEDPNGGDATFSSDNLKSAISTSQKAAVGEVQEKIDEIRQSASRAANSEFEEYRQLQEQRISELQNEISSHSDRLQNLSTEIDEAESHQQRIDVLEKRRELRSEKNNFEGELQERLYEKEQGFTQKHREIRERHTITVKTKPMAVTLVTYERGEIELELREDSRTGSIRAPYAIGAGVTDEVRCENCQTQLSSENPVSIAAGLVGCRMCL